MKGKVIVVTGSSRGMGKEIAELFLKNGAQVALLDLLEDELKSWAGNIADALIVPCNITDKAQVVAAKEKVLARFGKIDALINNAGWMASGRTPLEDYPEEDWKRGMEINGHGTFLMTQVFGGAMIPTGGGAIVNIASQAGFHAIPGTGSYCPSKSVVIMLTMQAALEWGKHNIRANAICPGQIETPINAHRLNMPGSREGRLAMIPLGRLGKPADVAKLAYFLASDNADYITGETILIDGGMTKMTAEPLARF